MTDSAGAPDPRPLSPPDRPLKVIVSVRPYRGHLHPMIPLARAFIRRGHSVVVATGEDMADLIAGAGLAWVPAGFNPRQTPEVSATDPDYGYPTVRAKVDDLLELAVSGFPPDIILRDPTDLAPVIVSEVTGAVNLVYGLSRFIPRESWEILGADRTVTRLRRDFRLPPDPDLRCMFSGLYLAVIPPVLEVKNPLPVEAVQRVAYVPWDGDGAATWEAPDEERVRPRVLVTLGTVYNSESDMFHRFLQALAGEDVDVLCALGEGADTSVIEDAPSNVHFETYLRFSKVLPHCDAMLCHGGFNTVMSALLAGVPMVVVPLGSDHDYNARICQQEGFGRALEPDEATPERLREAVRAVLDDPRYVRRIRDFRRQARAVPSHTEAVGRIEEFVAAQRDV